MQPDDPAIWQEIGLVLLAAGQGSRFGGDKLAAPLAGRPLLAFTAGIYAGLPLARRVVVLGGGGDAPAGFAEARIASGRPQSASLAAGIAMLAPLRLRAILVALADMPLVTPAHLAALARAFDGSRPVCSLLDEARCPPVLFPAATAEALTQRRGDQGARDLLACAVAVPAGPEVLLDIDTPADLARAAALLARHPGCR